MRLDYAVLCEYDELYDQWDVHFDANIAHITQKRLEKERQQAEGNQGHNRCSVYHGAVHVPLGDHVLPAFVARLQGALLFAQ